MYMYMEYSEAMETNGAEDASEGKAADARGAAGRGVGSASSLSSTPRSAYNLLVHSLRRTEPSTLRDLLDCSTFLLD
jgi:hypothetical protein